MRAKLHSPSYELLTAEPGCCALCKSKLPTEGIQYTPDFVFFARHGMLAHLTMTQARVMRALFKVPGFRMERGQLISAMYDGAGEANTAANVLSLAIGGMRSKLLPLGMGIVSDCGTVTLLFTPPGYRRVA